MTEQISPEALARITAAMSREGKPRGDHMIEAFAMLERHAKASRSRQQKELGETYGCASVCIANETRMFEELCAAVKVALFGGNE